ncbi:ABC transporter substrate-binding protein [Streptomyces sp. NRRL F-5126]|uniref:ABC transporter substrate-binding protein n=1 Tax=Streptomyces sp. NRRL F-5126 TaxID=1463857 RepID=UPI0004C87DB3|nr:extracellular solute-binding protein [Streptomyces sp. NRRL F-5126]
MRRRGAPHAPRALLTTLRSPVRTSGALLLAGTLTACGTAGGGGAVTEVAPAKQPGQLLAQARKEGKLLWYTTFADDDVAEMVSAFEKTYPGVKVEALRLSADKLPSRLVTEQRGGKFNADVISADSEPVYQLIKVGTLAPYRVPEIPPLPPQLEDLPDGYRNVVYVNTSTIAYNPQAVAAQHLPVPTELADLTKPAWKGRFSIDPKAINWYEGLISAMGHDKALRLVKKLGDNEPRLVESHTQSLTEVQGGEPAAVANAYGYKAAALKEKTPERLAFSNPNPLPSAAVLEELAKKAPHPAAAKLFIDWIMSKEGQRKVVSITNHVSLSDLAHDDPTVWNEKKWKPAWSTPVIEPDKYNILLQEYQKALHAI